jgi:hypothetical protein
MRQTLCLKYKQSAKHLNHISWVLWKNQTPWWFIKRPTKQQLEIILIDWVTLTPHAPAKL